MSRGASTAGMSHSPGAHDAGGQRSSEAVTLTAFEARDPVLEIDGPGGECTLYAVRSAPAGLDRWAVTLVRDDAEVRYRVAVDDEGSWRCSCDSFRYSKAGSRGCKHTRHVKVFEAMVRAFA